MDKKADLLLDASQSVLLLVDIQDKFRPGVAGMEALISRAEIVVRAAVRLGIPVLATEQYPKALGETVPELRQWLPDNQVYHAKLVFSAYGCETLRLGLEACKRRQVVLVGVETHVCVLQTGMELLAAGYSVHVVSDAVSSRGFTDRETALRRLEKHGVELVTAEMCLFEWLRVAGTPEFKELQSLIK
ncbi:MAG: hydrolase [Fibrobacteria bacterium]